MHFVRLPCTALHLQEIVDSMCSASHDSTYRLPHCRSHCGTLITLHDTTLYYGELLLHYITANYTTVRCNPCIHTYTTNVRTYIHYIALHCDAWHYMYSEDTWFMTENKCALQYTALMHVLHPTPLYRTLWDTTLHSIKLNDIRYMRTQHIIYNCTPFQNTTFLKSTLYIMRQNSSDMTRQFT